MRTQPVPLVDSHGRVGLVNTPTARSLPTGEIAATNTFSSLEWNSAITAQILPSLALAVRQTQTLYNNRIVDIAPGLDGKLTVLRENAWRPELAVGIDSLSGASHGAGEYIVASKRFWMADVSVGVGWGAVAGHDRSLTDDNDKSSPGGWFSGPPALFGGVQVQLPVPGMALAVEYDPNDHPRERLVGISSDSKLPVNVGLSYRPMPSSELGIAWEQGHRFMLRTTFHLDPDTLHPEPEPVGKPAEVLPRRGGLTSEPLILNALHQQGILAQKVRLEAKKVTVWLSNRTRGKPATAVGRAARVVANNVPESVVECVIVLPGQKMPGTDVSVFLDDIRRAAWKKGSPAEVWAHATVTASVENEADWGLFDGWDVEGKLLVEESPFEGTGATAGRAVADAGLTWQFLPGWTVAGGARLTLLSNINFISDEEDKPVRGDLAFYARPGWITGEHLYLQYADRFDPATSVRLAAGYLEEMFAGVEGELLYQPDRARWAIGAYGAYARKRPAQTILDVGEKNYVTSLVTLYYHHPDPELTSWLSVGEYLGGDRGAILDIRRALTNGVHLGSYAGWTYGGPAEDGRLSFGLSLRIPWGGSRLGSDRWAFETRFQPIARDYGQQMDTPRLIQMQERTSPRSVEKTWPALME